MSEQTNLIIDSTSHEANGLPSIKNVRYRCKLDTAEDVRREIAKLYRETRSGLLDPSDATKLGWLLGELRKTIELEQKTSEAQSNLSGYKFVVERTGSLPASIEEFI